MQAVSCRCGEKEINRKVQVLVQILQCFAACLTLVCTASTNISNVVVDVKNHKFHLFISLIYAGSINLKRANEKVIPPVAIMHGTLIVTTN